MSEAEKGLHDIMRNISNNNRGKSDLTSREPSKFFTAKEKPTLEATIAAKDKEIERLTGWIDYLGIEAGLERDERMERMVKAIKGGKNVNNLSKD